MIITKVYTLYKRTKYLAVKTLCFLCSSFFLFSPLKICLFLCLRGAFFVFFNIFQYFFQEFSRLVIILNKIHSYKQYCDMANILGLFHKFYCKSNDVINISNSSLQIKIVFVIISRGSRRGTTPHFLKFDRQWVFVPCLYQNALR